MHFLVLKLSGIKAFKRPVAVFLAAVFLAGGLFNTHIGEVLANKNVSYSQTPVGCVCLLESPMRWQQGTGVSQVLLPATVSLAAVPTILLFSATLPSAVLPSLRQAIPHLRGPPVF